MNILIVDDSRAMRLFMRRAVEAHGHTVTEAGDGIAALRALRVALPDVVLLDWNMPQADGMTTLEVLRVRHGEACKVVLTTAEADAERMTEAYAKGANGYITKPFTAQELIAAINLATS